MTVTYDAPTLEEVESALVFIDANMPRKEWVLMLMAIKNEFGDTGYDIAESWSRTGDSFNQVNFRATWRDSIKSTGGTTIKSLFKLAIDNGYEVTKKTLSEEEKTKRAKEKALRDERRKKEEAEALEAKKRWHDVIASLCNTVIDNYTIYIQSNNYLKNKKVNAFGVRGVTRALVLVIKPDFKTEIIDNPESILLFFKQLPPKDERDYTFLQIKRGDLVIPLIDEYKKLWSMQVINAKGTKMFPRHARTSGLFHFLGKASSSDYLAFAEGYATAATVHTATGWPCVMCLNAHNLITASEALKKMLPDKRFVFCADDDANTKDNPGVTAAQKAAKKTGGIVAIPDFKKAIKNEVAQQ